MGEHNCIIQNIGSSLGWQASPPETSQGFQFSSSDTYIGIFLTFIYPGTEVEVKLWKIFSASYFWKDRICLFFGGELQTFS